MTTADPGIRNASNWVNVARALALLPLAVVLLAFLAIREYV